MALIGNPLNSVAFLTDSFNGNGSTTAFTMSVAPATSSSILVNITGVTQAPSTYSVVGTTLTFSTAPPSGTANISVRYLGIPASGVTTTAYRTLTEFTATAGQTTFTPPSYTVGFIAVYQNGVMLGSTDYTATNGTTVVLAVGALVGDLISTESFYVSSVLNALPVTGGTISGNLVVTGTASITGVTTLTGGLNTPLAVASGGTGAVSLAAASIATYTGTETLTNKTLTSPTLTNAVMTGTVTIPLSYIRLNTANGYGSTNTKIRRFTNTVNNVGTDITYADSATLGATFTINTNGVYSASFNDQFNTTNNLGLSINSSQLTTNIELIAVADILSVSITPFASQPAVAAATFYATAGTVIRAHTQGGASGSQTTLCQFTIARVA